MEYFQHIKARVAFPFMQEHCRIHSLPSARSWSQLENLLRAASQVNASRASDLRSVLSSIFIQSVWTGHRAIRVFKIDPMLAPASFAKIEAYDMETSPYSAAYPMPIAANDLKSATGELYLSEKVTLPDGRIALIFCTKRNIEERDTRSRDEIGNEAINRFGWEEYEQFVLIRRRALQTYEIVILAPSEGKIEIRVEVQPGVDTGNSMHQLQTKLNEILGTDETIAQLVNPINMFPAINAIYCVPTEGTVVELGFTTETGSAKHEKMRSSRQDLRSELFHVGGKAAVNGILTPYRIAVRWPTNRPTMHQEALLPGSIRELSRGNPYLGHMELTGSTDSNMFNATIIRVLSYLP